MTARPLAVHGIDTTGQRAVHPPVFDRVLRTAAGARLIRTRRGLALFDDVGRFVGIVRRPDPGALFGPAGSTVLLHR